uniref:NADH dehydrogenase subunit 6 n=1 Tax=Calameuta filiformis TaxID=222804 RepID=A0A0S1S668_9HYME|nr:NADH dehydrogenase subunit 6 [Calameuta filiformis]ALM04138.1 NADH dehydrogenase subunit 6 [Calameuta filiformis]
MLMNFNLMMYMETLSYISLVYISITLITMTLLFKNTHPVELMVYLIMFSIIMCLKTSLLNKNFWFSYLLFLTMIGGILILFLYFVSTASNEMNNTFKMNLGLFMSTFIAIFIILVTIMYMYDSFSIMLIEDMLNQNLMFSSPNWSNYNEFKMTQMFNINYKITLMIMLYLLFTLFSVMKMCMKMYGPLRQFS